MILEYLAAAGTSAVGFTLTVGTQESTQFPDSFEYGYARSEFGSITPATFNGKTISGLYTFETDTFFFSLLSANSGRNAWDRMEFIRNGALEKTIYSAQCAYIGDVGGNGTSEQWSANGVNWKPVYTTSPVTTYSVRIYY